jgi:hypothetical protein
MNPYLLMPYHTKPTNAKAVQVDRANASIVAQNINATSVEIKYTWENYQEVVRVIFTTEFGLTFDLLEGDWIINDVGKGLSSMSDAAFQDAYAEGEVN